MDREASSGPFSCWRGRNRDCSCRQSPRETRLPNYPLFSNSTIVTTHPIRETSLCRPFFDMHSFALRSFVYSLCLLPAALALNIPFTVRSNTHTTRQSSSNNVLPVGNTQNSFYFTNITLGGRTISVMLDTGRYVSSPTANGPLHSLRQLGSMGDWFCTQCKIGRAHV